MKNDDFYSVRMLAQRDGSHHAGAERLCRRDAVERLAGMLVQRALIHPRGAAEEIRLTVEAVPAADIRRGGLPPVSSFAAATPEQGRQAAACLLQRAGVAAPAVAAAMDRLLAGAAGGGRNMRGAMLVDAASGRFLEPDGQRGVRVSRMDLAADLEAPLRAALAARGLDRPQVREALVLAAKLLAAPGVVAELCWSDDPDYVTGYVAAPELGYCRLAPLKAAGERHGGRAFFLSPAADVPTLIAFLERQPFLADRLGPIHPPRNWSDADAPL